MLCTAKGLLALALCFIAVVLSWSQLVLPQWFVTDNVTGVNSTVRSVGISSVCIRNSTKEACFSYFTAPNPREAFDHSYFPSELSNQSLCDAYMKHGVVPFQGIYPKEILDVAFLKRTCGSIGSSTFAFAIATAIIGTLQFVAYVVWSCANTAKSCLLALSKLLGFASLFANLLTITMWLVQQSSLKVGAGASLGISFLLSMISAIIYCFSIIAIGMLRLKEKHENIKAKSMRIKSLRDLERAGTVGKTMTLSI